MSFGVIFEFRCSRRIIARFARNHHPLQGLLSARKGADSQHQRPILPERAGLNSIEVGIELALEYSGKEVRERGEHWVASADRNCPESVAVGAGCNDVEVSGAEELWIANLDHHMNLSTSSQFMVFCVLLDNNIGQLLMLWVDTIISQILGAKSSCGHRGYIFSTGTVTKSLLLMFAAPDDIQDLLLFFYFAPFKTDWKDMLQEQEQLVQRVPFCYRALKKAPNCLVHSDQARIQPDPSFRIYDTRTGRMPRVEQEILFVKATSSSLQYAAMLTHGISQNIGLDAKEITPRISKEQGPN
ncbi:hypothetical protein B0H11DRAFT_1901705 [Mycena galericulata]|nr:hypothetical protein B0H11DRAFT_1901705 [Mycena galericulata]